jgi:hypothetical protein
MADLNGPASRRVRVNKHVELTNRLFRFLEKVRYTWRRRQTPIRFVVMRLDEAWRDRSPPKSVGLEPGESRKGYTLQPDAGQGPRRAA